MILTSFQFVEIETDKILSERWICSRMKNLHCRIAPLGSELVISDVCKQKILARDQTITDTLKPKPIYQKLYYKSK